MRRKFQIKGSWYFLDPINEFMQYSHYMYYRIFLPEQWFDLVSMIYLIENYLSSSISICTPILTLKSMDYSICSAIWTEGHKISPSYLPWPIDAVINKLNVWLWIWGVIYHNQKIIIIKHWTTLHDVNKSTQRMSLSGKGLTTSKLNLCFFFLHLHHQFVQ